METTRLVLVVGRTGSGAMGSMGDAVTRKAGAEGYLQTVEQDGQLNPLHLLCFSFRLAHFCPSKDSILTFSVVKPNSELIVPRPPALPFLQTPIKFPWHDNERS